ncbi:DUF2238 domain-containing protein [Paludibaculum fermentans]|uniref:DUF2238 domain-containing protein n=1 Tax=Paludibaculum fermentans TaxID=1473598 RepID=A0A7S7NKK3_PALFE|nr:DUF2238 domain-containing protein [Paludibaculum fermentans]QOY85346.1 DUF2238 domain-containing protein [Paludibaculum fermentans]
MIRLSMATMPRVLRVLCILLPLVLAITGFLSHILSDWWLENLAVFLVLLALALAYKRLPLSNTSWILLFLFLCFHEYGALYSYSNAPLGEWMMPWFHTQRNHYDRLVHLLFGLMLTWPALEAIGFLTRSRGAILYALGVQFILAASALYEITEWLVASAVDPVLGVEFIGAQGDAWDAAEDMAAALIGALVVVCVAGTVRAWRNRRAQAQRRSSASSADGSAASACAANSSSDNVEASSNASASLARDDGTRSRIPPDITTASGPSIAKFSS